MGIKSNNLLADYHDFFSRSGKDAVVNHVGPAPLIASVVMLVMEINPGNGWTYHIYSTWDF